MNIITRSTRHYETLICPCSHVLWQPTQSQPLISEQLNPQSIEEFSEEARPVKKIIREFNKVRKALSTVIKQEYSVFRTAITPLMDQLKELRTTSLRNVKQTDAYKQTQKYARVIQGHTGYLQQKYSLRYYQINHYFKLRWHRTSLRTIKRRFGIRL